MENYHRELEIRPIIHQLMLSEEKPVILEGIQEATFILFLTGRGKKDLGPWAGTHIREEGTKKSILVMKLEAKDMVKRMMPGGEMTTKKEGTTDHHGPMKISSSGEPPTRSLQNNHSR